MKGTSREEVDRASATIVIEANILILRQSDHIHVCMSEFQVSRGLRLRLHRTRITWN